MNKIEFDQAYIRRLSETLNSNASTIQHWNIATGMKLEQDGIIESDDKNFWNHLTCWIKDADAYFKKFKELLQKQYPDIFQSMKRTRTVSTSFKDVKQSYYKVELSNFSFILSLQPWSGRDGVVFHPKIYCYRINKVARLYINDTIEKFTEWIVKENAEMSEFRKEWEALCLDLRKRVMGNNLDESVVYATVKEMLGELKVDYTVTTGFNDHGRYIDIRCKSLDVLFHIPGGYVDWKKVIDVFVDIVKDRMKSE